MSSTLKFLQLNPQLLSKAKGGSQNVENTITQVNRMEGQLQKAEEVKRFLKERRLYLKEQLQNIGLAKELKKGWVYYPGRYGQRQPAWQYRGTTWRVWSHWLYVGDW
jgi:hypothetical protein